MENWSSELSKTTKLLWFLFGTLLIFSFLRSLYPTAGDTGEARGLFYFSFLPLAILYIYFRQRISKYLLFFLGFILTMPLWFFSTFVCVGYCNDSDAYPVLFGSFAALSFFSMFIVGTFERVTRLVFLGVAGVLVFWAMGTNSGFRGDLFGSTELLIITISTIYLLGLVIIWLRFSKRSGWRGL
ncbi:MAG: hypothetical protein A2991_03385 [Candidatus Terrybacteria bacterium RIFCSPLOWO2_01_FULL_58_14]|uniref:Uncharacterized protein n=1 Tax=Candidatus Terrybacteria bacterium RIFCSPLOWO2_01_FULL_58_14 TaxID=1802369 RepID=A0A1G2PVU8_9BACT|nr:MAG: hypothetical protein A2991_03385 [Candidatus Terrybacteria bacterium RIFCSPLOWO2_01_FULL_58_14]